MTTRRKARIIKADVTKHRYLVQFGRVTQWVNAEVIDEIMGKRESDV